MVGFGITGKVCLALTSVALLVGGAFADNINVNGANRNMLVYAPSGIEKDRPLIIQMHGYNQDAAYQKNAAKWESVADTGRFVVVFPNGENKSWDISGDKDLNFIKAIINEMNNKYGIDKKRVYVSGFSMGGMMSYHVANKMGDMIAAIAPVSGGGGVNSPKRAMPIMHTHGTSDDVVNYNSTVNTVKSWVSAQKCSSNSQKIKPYPTTKPGSAASLEIWSGCTDNVEVRLLTIEGKGHWYSMDEAVSVNTSVEIWNFVKNYSLDGPAVAPVDTAQNINQGDTPADSSNISVPTDSSKTVVPADSGKITVPADSSIQGISWEWRNALGNKRSYAVFGLDGRRIGTVEAMDATEAETLKKAKFGQKAVILRKH
jgi:poly(hydroxyalkanoate) depolymerase family esterase